MKNEIIKILIGNHQPEDLDNKMVDILDRPDCPICGHPLKPSERINGVVSDLEQFIISELKDLKEECVGKERKASWIKEDESFLNIDNAYATGLIEGDKNKRQEIIKAFAKRGV